MMIVVTGATGHLGNNLVRALLDRDEIVRCLVLPSESLRPLAGLEVEVVRGDVRRLDDLLQAFVGARVVYHLASVIAITPGQTDLLYEVNVGGTLNVIEACRQRGVGRLVYTSSIHALVEPPRGTTIDEGTPVDAGRIPFTYGKTKAMATLAVLQANGGGLETVVVNPTGIIGPYDFAPSEMGRLVVAFARGGMRVYLDGGYDFVDVRDVAAGLVAAAEQGRPGEGYLLSGEQITVREMLHQLAELTGLRPPRWRVPAWCADAAAPVTTFCSRVFRTKPLFTTDSLFYLRSNSVTNSTKARRDLGFRSRPVRESLADTVLWFAETGALRRVPKRRSAVAPVNGGLER